MNHSIPLWQLFGFAATSFGGTILHFLYDWLGKAAWIAPFSGVNESTWEHMKLLFWPMLLFAAVQRCFFRDRKDFWCIKLRGILLGMALIPTVFYTYNGVVGQSPDWLNISIFFVAAGAVYLYETRLFKADQGKCGSPGWAVAVLCGWAVLFAVFTFFPPELGVFRDPLTGSFGI